MSESPETPEIEEITLKFAASAVQAGVNKKNDLLQKDATEEQAYTQGANQALGIIHSPGADEQEVIQNLLDRRGLIDLLLENFLTEEEYAELVKGLD